MRSVADAVRAPSASERAVLRRLDISTFRRFDVSTFDNRIPAPSTRPAFTLIEMVIVVAIIAMVAALTLPAITTMWNERKLADAENTIQGLLMTTRANAIAAAEQEQGVLFYVDDKGVQRMVSIIQADVPEDDPDIPFADLDAYRLAYLDVFTIQEDRDWSMPAPFRVAPRYAVLDGEPPNDTPLTFSSEELANNDFEDPSGHQAQRHRNYFTMVFSAEGQLVDRRNVLIQDIDEDVEDPQNPRGDVTDMRVGYDHGAEEPTVFQYYDIDAAGNVELPLDQTGTVMPDLMIPFLVVGPGQGETAINFPSVDGLLLYDDALFNEIEDVGEKRAFLLETAFPLYVNRVTGGLISGPVGEVDADQ